MFIGETIPFELVRDQAGNRWHIQIRRVWEEYHLLKGFLSWEEGKYRRSAVQGSAPLLGLPEAMGRRSYCDLERGKGVCEGAAGHSWNLGNPMGRGPEAYIFPSPSLSAFTHLPVQKSENEEAHWWGPHTSATQATGSVENGVRIQRCHYLAPL